MKVQFLLPLLLETNTSYHTQVASSTMKTAPEMKAHLITESWLLDMVRTTISSETHGVGHGESKDMPDSPSLQMIHVDNVVFKKYQATQPLTELLEKLNSIKTLL